MLQSLGRFGLERFFLVEPFCSFDLRVLRFFGGLVSGFVMLFEGAGGWSVRVLRTADDGFVGFGGFVCLFEGCGAWLV